MKNKKNIFLRKKILIYGLGKSGISSYKFLKKKADVFLFDDNSKINKKLVFQNFTMVPIEKDLINFDLLTNNEKNYLFKYHLEVYSKISEHLKPNEKKWLASFI